MNDTNDEDEFKIEPFTGFFRASRYPDMRQLVKHNPNAFILAYAIAASARWNPNALNPTNPPLSLGEAICDYENWGLTEGEFRTAQKKLRKWGFATFHTAFVERTRVTIGRLVNTRLFDVLDRDGNSLCDGRNNGGATDEQRTNNGRATTYRDQEIRRSGERDTIPPSAARHAPGTPTRTRVKLRWKDPAKRRLEPLEASDLGESVPPQSSAADPVPTERELKEYAESRNYYEPNFLPNFITHFNGHWRAIEWRSAMDAFHAYIATNRTAPPKGWMPELSAQTVT